MCTCRICLCTCVVIKSDVGMLDVNTQRLWCHKLKWLTLKMSCFSILSKCLQCCLWFVPEFDRIRNLWVSNAQCKGMSKLAGTYLDNFVLCEVNWVCIEYVVYWWNEWLIAVCTCWSWRIVSKIKVLGVQWTGSSLRLWGSPIHWTPYAVISLTILHDRYVVYVMSVDELLICNVYHEAERRHQAHILKSHKALLRGSLYK